MGSRALKGAVSGLATALVTALMLSAAGCASIREGTAIRDPGADPGAVNPALLDPGKLPTKPRAPLGEAGDLESAKLVEARRMAEVVLLPFEIDAAYISVKPVSGPVISEQALVTTFFHPIPLALSAHNYVTGFLSVADTASLGLTDLANAVLRFATPEDAAAAAVDMGARAMQGKTNMSGSNEVMPTAREVPVPDHPGTGVYQTEDNGWFDVYAFTAHGPFVLAQAASTKTPDDAVRRVLAAVDKQRPALDGFAPTPVDKLISLPVDSPGLMARTLPSPPDALNAVRLGLYGPHGALNFMDNPLRDQPMFATNGLEWMSKGGSANVYQVRDAQAARRFADAFSGGVAGMKYSRAAPITGMPAAHCQLSPKNQYSEKQTFYCVMPVDRYVIEVVSPDERDAHQKVAAQYLMLTAK